MEKMPCPAVVGMLAALITLGSTKPKHFLSDSRAGIIACVVCVGGIVAAVHEHMPNSELQVVGSAISAWLLLWGCCYWDNSRGELAPRWRHLGVGATGALDSLVLSPQPLLLAVAAAVTALWSLPEDGAGVLPSAVRWLAASVFSLLGPDGAGHKAMQPNLPPGFTACCVLLAPALIAVRVVFGRPASYPGDARKARDLRTPSWPRHAVAPLVVEDGWRFAEAEESHAITERECANGESLSGEPAGRQIWYHESDHPPEASSSSSGRSTRSKTSAAAKPKGNSPFTFQAANNPNSADLLFRAQMTNRWEASGDSSEASKVGSKVWAAAGQAPPKWPTGKQPEVAQEAKECLAAARAGMGFYQQLQCEDGHWAGDYGGPHFLLPGLIVTWYVTGQLPSVLSAAKRRAMAVYLRNHQQSDGGWGTHIESPSTMFGTTLCYVGLRLLGGANEDDPACVRGRAFLRQHGGCLYTSSWAKLWLCVLGVMEWDGHNPVPPEMWLLPDWTPFHPGRLWCHCRMVYLPMCYLYGTKFTYQHAESDPLTLSLRRELYPEDGIPYEKRPWDQSRHWVADIDNYSPVHPLMSAAETFLRHVWERFGGWCLKTSRAAGLRFAVAYMHAEDLQTNYVNIGPVSKAMHLIVTWQEGGKTHVNNANFQKHVLRVPDYLWVAEDGMKMAGYNGSQCWDTSFAAQACVEAGLGNEFPLTLRRTFQYFEKTQILSTNASQATDAFVYESEDMRQQFYRHVSLGGWPFSTSAHGWPISDCTAEGLKAMLSMKDLVAVSPAQWPERPDMPDERYFNAANVLLTLQNTDGGFATYENNRGYAWFEWLNPSEVFGDIMIDYSYVECTNASIGALALFHKHFPNHRPKEVVRAVARARQFLLDIQRPDGSWYGSWGCCFTYASWFGVEGLLQAGEPLDSPALHQACAFLLKHQHPNGGWGEDFTSCFDKEYARKGMQLFGDDQGSGVVCTAWALLALMAAHTSDVAAVSRGVAYLRARQRANGDWPQEGISGVFNRACGITYTAYRNVFPVWALGRYANEYVPHLAKNEEGKKA